VGRRRLSEVGCPTPYAIEYGGAFNFPTPPDDVWSGIEHLERFETWWSWLREFCVEGPGLEAGTVLRGVVIPPLPYRMRIRVALLECVRPRRIEAAVHGDLEGHARLVLEPQGDGTRVDVTWTIEMMQLPMRVAARLAPRLLRWGHDRVVESTVASFRSRLRDVRRDEDQ